MSRFSFNRKQAELRKLLGIRARLALLGLILVAPLMLERTRSLEHARAWQIEQASRDFSSLVKHGADTQREVISSVETMLKSAAYIRASAGGVGRSCDMLRASLPVNLPWISSLSIVGNDGHIQCSTNNALVGLDLSERQYLKQARQLRNFVFSDFLFAISTDRPILIGAYPVSAIDRDSDSVIVAGINLDWLSKIMGNLSGRPGITAVLIDSGGIVMAAPANEAGLVGRPLDTVPLLSAIAGQAIDSREAQGALSFTAADGSNRALRYARIAGTQSRLIVSIDESKVTAAINREIRTAYLQLCFVCLFVLLGSLFAAEKLIIRPIEIIVAMARRFGEGDRAARVARSRLPAEFIPLARAFNAMAAQLTQRERELVATNDRLTVMASIDMLSGLANRRGFQSRLEFEWIKAQQQQAELSLLMIDVDHFKLYNDSYGHPEGDVCLSRLGETLARIAADCLGFAGRYGGEEFCLLLPNTDSVGARQIGEMVRQAVWNLAMPHATSAYQQVSVSIGVASARPHGTLPPGELVEAADAALYAAKHRGRNAVVEHGLISRPESSHGMALAG